VAARYGFWVVGVVRWLVVASETPAARGNSGASRSEPRWQALLVPVPADQLGGPGRQSAGLRRCEAQTVCCAPSARPPSWGREGHGSCLQDTQRQLSPFPAIQPSFTSSFPSRPITDRQRGMTVAVLSVLAGPSSLSFPRPSTSAISAASSFGTGLGHEQTTAQACTC